MTGTFRLPMHNPPHPGEVIRAEIIEAIGLTVTDAAKALGVSRQALSGLEGLSHRSLSAPTYRPAVPDTMLEVAASNQCAAPCVYRLIRLPPDFFNHPVATLVDCHSLGQRPPMDDF